MDIEELGATYSLTVLKMGENYMAIVNSTESLDLLNDLDVWGSLGHSEYV